MISKFPFFSKKFDEVLVYLCCCIFLFLSVLLYKERVIFADTAAYIVHIMTRETFEISMHSRFVGALTQILPYIAIKLHCTLKIILILYSVNFMLVPVTCAVLSVRWFKETKTAWSIFFLYSLMSISMFYYPVSEYQIGLCLFLFYIGFYEYCHSAKPENLRFIIISLLLIPSVIFSHPLSAIVMMMWLVLQFFLQKKERKSLLWPSAIAAISIVAKKLFFVIGYEENKTSGLNNFMDRPLDTLTQGLSKTFLNNLVDDYFLLLILMICSVVIFIIQKKYWLSLLFPLVILSWWILVSVSFKDAHYDHYYEHMYQAIPFFIAWGFCRHFLPAIKAPVANILILFILSISLIKIYNERNTFQKRFAWMNRCFAVMNELNCKKAILTVGNIPMEWDYPAMWSIPYEALLLSSLESNSMSKIILVKCNLQEAEKVENEVLDVDIIGDNPLVPSQYFKIANTEYCIPELTLDEKTIRNIKEAQKTN